MIGHIKIDRKILNWEWYTDHKVFHLFLYLLLKANHKEGNWHGNSVKRGQLITGRFKISKDTGLTESEIRTCLNKLKRTNEIAIKTTKQFSIVTICKYDVYQSNEKSIDQHIDQQHAEQLTNESPTIDQRLTTNKNDKKIFINKPLPEHFNGLSEIKVGSIIQLIKITKNVFVSEADVLGLWEVFKIQHLTGKRHYQDEDDVYSHFTNWAKDKRFDVKKALIQADKLPDANEVAKKYQK